MKILLDTNFLIYLVRYKILSELDKLYFKKLIIPQQVLAELQRIAIKGKGKDKEAAKIALFFVEKLKKDKKIVIKKVKAKTADDALIMLAEKTNAVATLDKGLIKRLKNVTKIINIRQKKYISA